MGSSFIHGRYADIRIIGMEYYAKESMVVGS
jgi:hypothetical protein